MKGIKVLRNKVLILLFGVLLTMVGEGVAAEKARVQEAFVVNSQQDLLLYFNVDGAISAEMEKGILTGIPVTFSFFVELYEHQGEKGPIQIASRNFRHTLYFETLKEVFDVALSEHQRENVTFRDFEQATRAMVGVHDLSVASLSLLKPGFDYTVKMRAELAKQDLPEKFKNVMTFIKIWDFETPWAELTFTMAPDASGQAEGRDSAQMP